MTVGFPSFLLELVSELAKVLPIQGIHGIWTALCLHYDNACRIIVLLGRDTSSFIGLVYQHPIAILLVILCFGATYLGSFVLASNRALVARVNPPPVHELPAFVVANAPSYMLALLERKETEENYENRIVSSFSVVFEVMPFLIYFLILFLTMSFLPVNMRRGAAIVSIALLFIMWLPHLLTMSWIERKSSYPFLLSLTDALMTGPLMESNHGFFLPVPADVPHRHAYSFHNIFGFPEYFLRFVSLLPVVVHEHEFSLVLHTELYVWSSCRRILSLRLY